MNEEMTFMCCFCGDTCDGRLQVLLARYEDEDGEDDPEVQTWFTHFGCFERALTEEARVFDQDEVNG